MHYLFKKKKYIYQIRRGC